MSQPTSGDQWTYISAVGSVVVSTTNVTLKRVILPGTFVGTVEFFDSATVAGTALTNRIYSQGLPLLNQYTSVEINARTRDGLVYAATGTPTLTFTWD